MEVSNPDYYVVDEKKCDAIAIINNEIVEPIGKIESGYYRFSDGHVESVRNLDVERRYTYKGLDEDKYIAIGVRDHCSIIQKNDVAIRQIQKYESLDQARILSLQKNISKNKTYEVQLGL